MTIDLAKRLVEQLNVCVDDASGEELEVLRDSVSNILFRIRERLHRKTLLDQRLFMKPIEEEVDA